MMWILLKGVLELFLTYNFRWKDNKWSTIICTETCIDPLWQSLGEIIVWNFSGFGLDYSPDAVNKMKEIIKSSEQPLHVINASTSMLGVIEPELDNSFIPMDSYENLIPTPSPDPTISRSNKKDGLNIEYSLFKNINWGELFAQRPLLARSGQANWVEGPLWANCGSLRSLPLLIETFQPPLYLNELGAD